MMQMSMGSLSQVLGVNYTTFYFWVKVHGRVPAPTIRRGKRLYYDEAGVRAVTRAVEKIRAGKAD